MRRDFLMVSVAVLAVALPQAALCQEFGPRDSVVRAALARIAPGKQIRLHAVARGRLVGPLV